MIEALERRKTDIKSRVKVLSDELTPLLAKVENLRTRIGSLEIDLSVVLEQIRIEKDKEQRDAAEKRKKVR